jgi:hypothetical protein
MCVARLCCNLICLTRKFRLGKANYVLNSLDDCGDLNCRRNVDLDFFFIWCVSLLRVSRKPPTAFVSTVKFDYRISVVIRFSATVLTKRDSFFIFSTKK